MPLDHNTYTVIYLSHIVIPAGVYAILLRRGLPVKVSEYFAERFNDTRAKQLFAQLLSCSVLFLPVAVAVSLAVLVLFSLEYAVADFPVKNFLSTAALTVGFYAAFIAVCFSGASVIHLRSKVRTIMVSCVLCFCASFFFVAAIKTFSDSRSSFEVTEPEENLKSRIHDFFPDTFLSEIPIKLVKTEEVNAHAGGGAIYIDEGLVKEVSPAELNSVMAHEASHLYHRDAVTAGGGLLIALVVFMTIVWIFKGCKRFNRADYAAGKNLSQNFCVVLLVSLLCVPFAKIGWTQFIRANEVRADAEAVEYLVFRKLPVSDFENALIKTGKNLAEPTFLTDWLMFDHPTTQERINNIRETEARIRLGEPPF